MTVEDRIAELEEFARRVIPAREGTDGWVNFIETRLLQERNFSHDVVAHALALLRTEILDTAKAAIETALARRVRGTHNPQSEYSANDIVAKDGGSFIARKDHPGKCPGDGWQLMAKQGQRGVRGERGERGRDAPRIERWIVDRAALTVTPVYSDGIFGPALELRELFAQFQSETT
jgi:hypothetical protein